MSARRRITVLGSTGSIGCSTLDLIGRDPDAFEVVALTANTSVDKLAGQARRFRPSFVAVADPAAYAPLCEALAGTGIEVGAGPEAVIEAARRPTDWVMAAIVGAAGLEPTMAAVREGVTLALANKESLVCAGDILMAAVDKVGAVLLPVDSEHNAIHQVIDMAQIDRVERIILTASGGPFRTMATADMARVTPVQAVAHPNWDMGAKISVDSATMMNKGLELIEATHLFPVPPERIDILVHPQSVVHSLVSFVDGSVLAQMGTPDMRTPISYALGWPRRMATPCSRLDLAQIGTLSFEPPDSERFPALRLARWSLQSGGGAPTILNAANEEAVASFLAGRIGFLDICAVVSDALAGVVADAPGDIAAVIALDAQARRAARTAIDRIGR